MAGLLKSGSSYYTTAELLNAGSSHVGAVHQRRFSKDLKEQSGFSEQQILRSSMGYTVAKNNAIFRWVDGKVLHPADPDYPTDILSFAGV